ncbi:uncharacterized protein J4E78_002749 [Alternaria triticimaculans]|uniref:uncharacterized protein n=1 Tax=Alternaria triticimaculans TaxID=297637 RepID=UPI0020C3847A|nr:uncharacterized protein J4E78_002749 [Alternaria triticimaculans]KAI4665289.1 hypothetical protein J4E78_002749 [Alternaria triticimaculans]
MDTLHYDTHVDRTAQPSDVSRSRYQRNATLPLTSGHLETYFKPRRPLHYDNEFGGGPDIFIADVKGESRPAHDDDYGNGQITGLESSRSDEESSIHKVEDMGFEAAANHRLRVSSIPSDYDSIVSNSLGEVFLEREQRQAAYMQKPPEATSVQCRLRKQTEESLDSCQSDEMSAQYLPMDSFETIFNLKSIVLLLDETYSPATSQVNPMFALKAIQAEDHKAYREELSALEKTCTQLQKEKHLIKLLLTFQHGSQYYLLFEWADGDLAQFWKRYSSRPPSILDERWAAEQCLGLAKAVSRIHGLTTWQMNERSSSFSSLIKAERHWGRHGDIKPENILWFQNHGRDPNLLVISDLGLTRYHSQFSKSVVPRSDIDGHTLAYRPPDLDMDDKISQRYDIWSLGCVFLEFCVWYLQGYDEVAKFSFDREDEDVITYEHVYTDKFFNIEQTEDGHKEPRVKKAVQERLETLKGLSAQTTFAKELLYIIEKKMLRCAPGNREMINVIKTDLSEILHAILKQSNSEDVSQDLAGIKRDNSAPSLDAPRNISIEDTRQSTTESPDTPTEDDKDDGIVMRTRSQRLTRENRERSEVRQNLAPGTDAQAAWATPAADAVTETPPQRTNIQPSEEVLEPGQTEASHGHAAGSGLHESSATTTKNKIRQRVSQRSRKWLREHLIQLKRMWKS